MRKWLTLFLVLIVTGVAFGAPSFTVPVPLTIPTIDGDLSEWDADPNTEWIPIDKVYYGDPIDIPTLDTNPSAPIIAGDPVPVYALKWSSSTNLIYLAVRYEDMVDNRASSLSSWTGQDFIEVYVDAGNSDDNDPMDFQANQDTVQQFGVGAKPTSGYWVVLANGGASVPGDLADCNAMRVGTLGLSYELALEPWTARLSSVKRTLAPFQVIGLDVAIDSLGSSTFGMMCNNVNTGKAKDAGQFQDHMLHQAGADPADCALAITLGYGMALDEDGNCHINEVELSTFLSQWLHCVDPGDANCDKPWPH